jgi:iron complex outermembrane recepter protein
MLKLRTLLMGGAGVAMALAAVSAQAQVPGGTDQSSTKPAAKSSTEVGEVIVTGTLFHGVAPVGTNVIGVTHADIVSTGVMSTDDILSTIPVITTQFNTVPTVGTNVGISTIRPNIRNIGAAGGTTTLVLMDGHNLVGAGVLQTTPDAGVIPPGVIQRVEVMPDGGSSIYGADALGGIINFITRKNMEGVEADAHAGFADNYEADEVNLTGGHRWDGGSLLLSYDYRSHTDLLGGDRSYYRQDLRSRGGKDFRGDACSPGNVTVNSVNYAMPGLAPNTLNQCDTDLYNDLVPSEQQNSLFASLDQALTSRLQFDVTAYYTNRLTRSLSPQDATTNAPITALNPFFQSVGGALAEAASYSYASVYGNTVTNSTDLDEAGITPTLTFDAGNGWEIKALGNYGRSETQVHEPQINAVAESAALAGTTTSTALDPYDLALTNPTVLSAIHNFEDYGRSIQQLAEGRVIADGPIMSLPGGQVRLAAGLQYSYQSSDALFATAPPGDLAGAASARASRNVLAEFGELLVPIVGPSNAFTGMQALSLDLSLRHDQYSDFGGTTNPKVGFTYEPFHGFSIRGNYGTSFNAPSLADSTGAVDTRAQVISISPFIKPGDSFLNFFRPTIVLAGGTPGLKPQTAHTYSVGGDWRPDQVPGLDLSVTYWNVSVYKEIGLVPFTSTALFTTPAYSKYFTINPTLAQAQALTAGEIVNGAPSIAALYAFGPALSPYIIIDARRKNLGNEFLDGLDFNASYTYPTSFGHLLAGISGAYTLDRNSQAFGGAPLFDELTQGLSRLNLTGSVGAVVGQFTARASIDYTAGFNVLGVANQTHVGAFDPINLYFAYNFVGGYSLLHDTSLTLNVDNVFDQNPAFENITGGIGNGSTLGRFVNLGLHKKF